MNTLYYGDNLEVLRKKIKDETVDLCYIDPPFNSKRNYNQIYNNLGREDRAQAQAFIDTWTWDKLADTGLSEIRDNTFGTLTAQSINLIFGLEKVLGHGSLLAYLISMTLRIAEIHRVLKSTGSFYLHCDPTASHYLKLVVDSIFVSQGGDYKNEIVWARTNAHNITAKYFARLQDTIFFYTKSDKYTWNPSFTDFSPQQLKRYFPDPSTGRLVTGQDLTMTGNASRNFTWRGTTPPPHRGWGFSEAQLDALWEQGLILTKQDGSPRLDGRKVFLDEKQGKPLGSVWGDIERIGNTSSERLGYPTQKPEGLLDRIIGVSTNEGDTVLDAYCGCGTTVAVAEFLRRQWIGIDITYQSISLILKRLEEHFGNAILNTIMLNGIPQDMESAIALAHKKDDRTRKEFEKWAVLSYSNNRAIINEKKGGDKGIDGISFVSDLGTDDSSAVRQVYFSVKSNETLAPTVVRDLNGAIERDGAVMGYLLTLYPMPNLVKEAKQYGVYENKQFGHTYPKIEVISAEEILNGKRMNLPISLDVLKEAERKHVSNQSALNLK